MKKDMPSLRICVWFALNPEVPMSATDLNAKFAQSGCRSVRRSLLCLLEGGYVSRAKLRVPGVGPVWHYLPGPELLKEIER